MNRKHKLWLAPVLGSLCIAAAGDTPVIAQAVSQITGQSSSQATVQTVATQAAPQSMLDQAAAPASVTFANGKLSIQATNSSLRAILQTLESETGTKVEGLSHDERIFGVYGPGNPQEVLSALLDDSGYNVLIDGRRGDGSAREVVLSQRTTAAQPATGSQTQASQEDDENEGAEPPPQQPPQPQANPLPPPSAPGPGQVKTPQQMLEELQRIRQQSTSGQSSSPQ